MLPYVSPISTTWGTLLRFLIGHCNILVTLSLYAKKQVKISDKLFSMDTPLEQIIKENPCLVTSVAKGKYSDAFYKKFGKTDFIDLIHKIDEKDYYKKLNFKEKVFYILREKIKLWR